MAVIREYNPPRAKRRRIIGFISMPDGSVKKFKGHEMSEVRQRYERAKAKWKLKWSARPHGASRWRIIPAGTARGWPPTASAKTADGKTPSRGARCAGCAGSTATSGAAARARLRSHHTRTVAGPDKETP